MLSADFHENVQFGTGKLILSADFHEMYSLVQEN